MGDLNDRAATARIGPYVIGGITVFGGSGVDVLTGSPTSDILDGGGGTDVLTGGDGGDTLSDGDRDDAAVNVSPDADLPRRAIADGAADVDPLPQRNGGALGFDLSCPELDGYRTNCRTTLRIFTRSDHRLLATGRLGNRGSVENLNRFLRCS